ncbi:hypothetical protein HY623_04205 [Candidatus Uhrbacteria bacterium]|nr:hypothetical protein [Candidatus Uhrbacteria bacterium]
MIITIVSIIITIACLSLLLSIIGKRWNAVQAIDLESLPSERDARVKKKILTDRFKRQYNQVKARAHLSAAPLVGMVRDRLGRIGASLIEVLPRPRSIGARPAVSAEQEGVSSAPPRIEHALSDAARLCDAGEFEEAEKRYIDIIAKDAKNLAAYEGLSSIYLRQKEWASAREVLEFLCAYLREQRKKELDPQARSAVEMSLAEWLKELAVVYLATEKGELAEQASIESLELQPQNPKFLDASLEMYIILGKKREARAALSRLRQTNPENQKLEDFEKRIENL